MNDNKKIAINTIAIYVKLIITTLVSLITSRYVLLALGQSDFGLYNVVGSIIVLINTVGIAMHTTTRRYINVEMGKGAEGNPNKIFNISLLLHIGFAFAFFLVAETIGIWYINNYLQVEPGKLDDAHFVFQISTIVACIGLINIPYQGLMDAFQKFWQQAIIDIIITFLKLAFVIALIYYDGNALRFFAISASLLTFASFILYHLACYKQWPEIIKYKFYKDKALYKEILVFNNYTALGATSCLGRTQGSAMLINYFFGTMVNGALAVAYQIQSFTGMFANNLATASAPQITQSYSAGDNEKAIRLASNVCRMTILILCCIFFPLNVGLEKIMELWLKNVPEGAVLLTRWVLIVSVCSSFVGCLSTYEHATGKIKWFQILGSIQEISLLPISFFFFYIGFPPVTILIVLATITLLKLPVTFVLLRFIVNFPSLQYIKQTYPRPLLVIGILTTILFFVIPVVRYSMLYSFIAVILIGILTLTLCFYIGLKKNERIKLVNTLLNKIKNR